MPGGRRQGREKVLDHSGIPLTERAAERRILLDRPNEEHLAVDHDEVLSFIILLEVKELLSGHVQQLHGEAARVGDAIGVKRWFAAGEADDCLESLIWMSKDAPGKAIRDVAGDLERRVHTAVALRVDISPVG